MAKKVEDTGCCCLLYNFDIGNKGDAALVRNVETSPTSRVEIIPQHCIV